VLDRQPAEAVNAVSERVDEEALLGTEEGVHRTSWCPRVTPPQERRAVDADHAFAEAAVRVVGIRISVDDLLTHNAQTNALTAAVTRSLVGEELDHRLGVRQISKHGIRAEQLELGDRDLTRCDE
jgi:hypothetical protein